MAERLKALSCWGGSDVSIVSTHDVKESLQLGEGRTNQNFVADVGGRRFFVRLGGDLPFFSVSRPREQAASRAAAAADLSPSVHHTEPPDVLVLDFVDGRALTEADVHKAAAAGPGDPLLGGITQVIRRLHAVPIPQELADFAGPLCWGGPHFTKWLAYVEEKGFSRAPLLEGVRELVARLERAAGPLSEESTPRRFCHWDLLADNLVLRKDGAVLLVDFEYSAPGQPLMDLAVLSMGCSLAPDEERNLLASYLQADVSEEQLYRFSALKVLAALRETLWGTTAELSESSSLSLEDARAYVDMNFAKLQQMRADFEALPVPGGCA